MTIWGKIFDGAASLGLEGPLGALLRALGISIPGFDNSDPDPERAKRSIGFTIAVIVLGAKMAKADGVVTDDEVDAFKQVFQVPEEEMKNVARVFNQARKDANGYEPYAKQVAGMFETAPEVLEELLWCLAHIAKADGIIHPGELELLTKVSDIFGFDESTFERVTALNRPDSETDPFRILGVTRECTDEDIKRAHRALVIEHHPDKLVAKGMPQEFISLANDRLAKINSAYDAVRRQRGLA